MDYSVNVHTDSPTPKRSSVTGFVDVNPISCAGEELTVQVG